MVKWDKVLAEHDVGDKSSIMGPFFSRNFNRTPLSACILVESELHSCMHATENAGWGWERQMSKTKIHVQHFSPFEGCAKDAQPTQL